MPLKNKKVKLSKKQLQRLAEAIKNLELKNKNKKREQPKIIDENKFIEHGINLEKISPVLKPVAETPALENIASSFQLKKETEKIEKPYEFGEQKYSSQSSEYKTLKKIQTENLQTPAEIQKNMTHMGIEQSTKRKSERFFEEKSEKEYKNFMYDMSEER